MSLQRLLFRNSTQQLFDPQRCLKPQKALRFALRRAMADRKRLRFSQRFFVRSEKLQNESFPNFSIFRPEFCPEFFPEFSPNFLRSFRASFCGRRRPEKIHQKSPPFFNAKFPGKFEEKIHKIFLAAVPKTCT